MLEKRIKILLMTQFNIVADSLRDEDVLLENLGLDLVDLSLALEETFELKPVEDLSQFETLGDLVDFVQNSLDM